eukprot:gene30357-35362_t
MEMQEAGWNGPPAWFGPQRVPSGRSTRTWVAKFDKEHVSKLIEAARVQDLGGWASDAMDIAIPGAQGGRVYHKGYYFQAAMDVQRQPTDPPTFDVMFALRVSRALEVSGDAKEVVEDKPADAHQLDQGTWDSEMIPLPVCVQANLAAPTYGAILTQLRIEDNLLFDAELTLGISFLISQSVREVHSLAPVASHQQRVREMIGTPSVMGLAPFDIDDHLFSDVRVFFSIEVTSEDGEHGVVAKQDANLSFLAHKHILAHSSPVLKAMLLRAADEQSGEEQQPMYSPMELEIPIEEEELLAAKVLIHHMYTGDFTKEMDKVLDKAASSQQAGTTRALLLVILYRLADRLEVKGCLEECATAITNLEGKDLGSADDINYICSIMSSAPLLCDKPPFDGLFIQCGKQLLIHYPDATALCKSCLEEVGPFQRLTFHAMLALISLDQIQADSENDVLALACIWVRHNTPSQSQLSLLSQRIRLKHLTPSFLVNLKSIAPWFAATQRTLNEVLSLQGCTMEMQEAGWNGPPAWFGPQRVPSGRSTGTWVVKFDKEYATSLIEAARVQDLGGWASDAMDIAIPGAQGGGRVYHKGYYFQGAMDVQRQPTDPPTFELMFALRVSRALEDSGDAKEVVTDKPADAQVDQATWDSEMIPLPVFERANLACANSGAISVKLSKSGLLSMNQSWMRTANFYTGTVNATNWVSWWNGYGALSVTWNLSRSC